VGHRGSEEDGDWNVVTARPLHDAAVADVRDRRSVGGMNGHAKDRLPGAPEVARLIIADDQKQRGRVGAPVDSDIDGGIDLHERPLGLLDCRPGRSGDVETTQRAEDSESDRL